MKPFRCKKCKKPIGLTDGKFLYVGGMALSFKTTGICLHCEQVNCWRPLIGNNGHRPGVNLPLVFVPVSMDEESG